MRLRHLITTSAAVLAVGLAGPVMAQQTGPGQQANGGSTAVGGDNRMGNTHTDTSASGGSNAASRGGVVAAGNTLNHTDTTSGAGSNSASRGGSIDNNSASGSGINASQGGSNDTLAGGGYAASRGGVLLVGNSYSSTRNHSDSNSGANGLSASRGAEVDTSATGNGSYAASRGGRNYVGNTATDTTSGAGGVSASRGAELGAVAMGGSYAANDGGSISNGNTSLVADQELDSTVSGNMLTGAAPEGSSSPGSPFNGGSNSVSGSSFAAYAGILNQGWNTGFASNVQSASNIAAQGTVTFTGGANGRTSP